MNINDLTNTIQGIKDAKEDLRGAINAKGGELSESAKLDEFAQAVEGLSSGASDTSIDFGSAYSNDINTVAGRLEEDLSFTKEVEEGLASGKYNEDDLLKGTQMVDFRGESYVFKDRIAFYPKGMKEPSSCQNMRRLIQWDRVKPTGYLTFQYCSSLQSYTNDLSTMTNGNNMLQYCSSLHSFISDLSALTNSNTMFYQCVSLQHVVLLGWGECVL